MSNRFSARHKHNIYICHADADADAATTFIAYIFNVANSWHSADSRTRTPLSLSLSHALLRSHFVGVCIFMRSPFLSIRCVCAVCVRLWNPLAESSIAISMPDIFVALSTNAQLHAVTRSWLYIQPWIYPGLLNKQLCRCRCLARVLVPKAWLGIPKPPSLEIGHVFTTMYSPSLCRSVDCRCFLTTKYAIRACDGAANFPFGFCLWMCMQSKSVRGYCDLFAVSTALRAYCQWQFADQRMKIEEMASFQWFFDPNLSKVRESERERETIEKIVHK